MKIGILAFLIFCLPAFIFAQERPAPEEAQKVVDYYNQGKGSGAILMAHKLCQEVYEEGQGKYECKTEVTDAKIGKGQEIYLWMSFLVPAGDKADLFIQFKRKNNVRHVLKLELPSAVRYRTWKKIPADKIGDWELSIIQELEDGDLNLGALSYSVTE
jgi:hypothetical protein